MTREVQRIRCSGCRRYLPPDCIVTETEQGETIACCGPACAEKTRVNNVAWRAVERDRFFETRRGS
jgi:transcription initiation factor TFIIIB Brf1 subunit/transcription initiation factor TFIIB